MQNKQTMSPKLENGLQKLTCNTENIGARLYHRGLNNKLEKMEEKPRLLKWKAGGLNQVCRLIGVNWSNWSEQPYPD